MRCLKFRSYCAVLLLAFDMQSLVDVAREETERRKSLEQQGIEGKVVEGNGPSLAPNGNITTSTGPAIVPEKTSTRSGSPKGHATLYNYQTALKKLDREIGQNEERLASRQARLQAEKWVLPKTRRVSGGSRTKSSQGQLQAEIEGLQTKLKRLRKERSEVYELGKKAGFLPGELENKGLVP
jgi:chromosome segregation ATPase